MWLKLLVHVPKSVPPGKHSTDLLKPVALNVHTGSPFCFIQVFQAVHAPMPMQVKTYLTVGPMSGHSCPNQSAVSNPPVTQIDRHQSGILDCDPG